MSFMIITCGQCGHKADIDEWTHTLIMGDLPPNQFQCPKCQHAFERRHGKPTVCRSGFVLPGPVSLDPIGARL